MDPEPEPMGPAERCEVVEEAAKAPEDLPALSKGRKRARKREKTKAERRREHAENERRREEKRQAKGNANKLQMFQVSWDTNYSYLRRTAEGSARARFVQDQAQNRRWLLSQIANPDVNCPSIATQKELMGYFTYESEEAQKTSPSLSEESFALLRRLQDERAAAKNGEIEYVDRKKRDWFPSLKSKNPTDGEVQKTNDGDAVDDLADLVDASTLEPTSKRERRETHRVRRQLANKIEKLRRPGDQMGATNSSRKRRKQRQRANRDRQPLANTIGDPSRSNYQQIAGKGGEVTQTDVDEALRSLKNLPDDARAKHLKNDSTGNADSWAELAVQSSDAVSDAQKSNPLVSSGFLIT